MATGSRPPPTFAGIINPTRPHPPFPAFDLPEGWAAKIAEIVAHFNAEGYELPVKTGADERTPLGEREMMFLSREAIIRYMIAVKGDKTAAVLRLEKTLVWRRTEHIDDIDAVAADCEPESRTGKNLLLGYGSGGRPIIYFFPNRNTTPVEQRRAIHAVFMLERASDLMADGVTNTFVVFSFAGKRQGQPTSVSVAREMLHILAEHYPEKLYLSHFLAVPWIVKAFVNLMWPFVDANTKRKVKFEADLIGEGDVDKGELLKECGGELDLPYDHDTYWPAMLKACKDRREADLARWRGLGPAQAGREERLFKVGAAGQPPVKSPASDVD